MIQKPEIYSNSLKLLKLEVKNNDKIVVLGGKTSTVIPYQLSNLFDSSTTILNLSKMPKQMEILPNGDLKIQGAVDWREARIFCEQNDREILTAPTEDTAHILSGLATSATGERCFGFGTLRDQVVSIKYLDVNAEERELFSKNKFILENFSELLNQYQKSYLPYKNFKNAPFPRFERETDLLIGTEGQMGVIFEAVIKTKKKVPTSFFFMMIPRWENNDDTHLEIFNLVQKFRDKIYSCELIDSNSLSVLPKEENPGNGKQDLVFIEFESKDSDFIYENFILKLKKLNQDMVFEIGATKCHELRMKVPRLTFERNSQMGVVKKGTDVQMSEDRFKDLLEIYRQMSKLGIDYNLFGHFGDAHLHFNFMPSKNDVKKCDEELEKMYKKVRALNGSPFAEHGIGIIKKKFIKDFYGKEQVNLFKKLKEIYDPTNKFFPEGFMNISGENL